MTSNPESGLIVIRIEKNSGGPCRTVLASAALSDNGQLETWRCVDGCRRDRCRRQQHPSHPQFSSPSPTLVICSLTGDSVAALGNFRGRGLIPKVSTVNSPDHSSSPIELTSIGWDEHFSTLFADHAADDDVPARVVRVDRGGCDTLTAAGPVRAVRSSHHIGDRELAVCTGDWVVLRRDDERAQVVGVLPRRTAIARASSDRTSERQVLAANVDTVIIAVSVAHRVNVGRIERLLTLAYDAGTRPVIALTKSDLVDDTLAGEAAVTAVAPGAEIVTTSTVSGVGIDLLASAITGTAVLLGSSGAGKSSLANALLGREHMAARQIRSVDGKGRHTTAHRELLPLPGSKVLIDTPGLRGIGVQDVADAAGRTFAEIEELSRDCGFRDCEHRSEPRCAVQEAIREGRLDAGRLERYRKLLRESEWSAARGDARRSSKRNKRDKAITRDIRAMYRFRDRQG